MRTALFVCLALLAQSASAQISVRSSLSDDREALPGSRYQGVIDVWNETDQLQEAKIYQTDYLFFSDGSNVYGDPGLDQRSNASWTNVSVNSLTLPPNQRVPITYEVQVPESLDGRPLEGSYWSMIMVEAVPTESPESTIGDSDEPQYSVLQLMRYGVQIATHIAGTGQKDLQLTETKLVSEETGDLSLYVFVDNQGSRMARPEVWVELYNEQGESFGRRESSRNRIYPGTSVKQALQLGSLNPGMYRALVVLDDGENDVFGAEYRLKID